MNALVLVDLQYDFLPGGALAVPSGDEVIAVANDLMPRFDLVIATRDWHPRNHGSFASQHRGKKPGDVIELEGVRQVLWPDHCVQGTRGAEFHDSLRTERIAHIVSKGADPHLDSYSAFFDNARKRSTGLEQYLREWNIEHVSMLGLATDYCVKFSALDAAELGFRVTVFQDGCRGIDLHPGDIEAAWESMRAAGVTLSHSSRS